MRALVTAPEILVRDCVRRGLNPSIKIYSSMVTGSRKSMELQGLCSLVALPTRLGVMIKLLDAAEDLEAGPENRGHYIVLDNKNNSIYARVAHFYGV